MLLIVMRRVGRPRALAFSSRAAAANLRSGPRGERFGRANGPYGRASDLFGRVSACRGRFPECRHNFEPIVVAGRLQMVIDCFMTVTLEHPVHTRDLVDLPAADRLVGPCPRR